MDHRETIEWCDIWIEDAHAETRPRALFIGDSITRSYYQHVRDQLTHAYACARLATAKCVADSAYLRELDLLLHDYTFAVIHLNNGLHGWDYHDDAYAEALARTMDLLIAHAGANHLIWASSTPIWEKDGSTTLSPKTDRVRQRNRLAAELATARGIPINDLFAAVVNRPDLVSNDGVHFQPTGQAVLGDCVIEAIRKPTP